MATSNWSLDPTHSELGFKIKHLMITHVSGSFKDFQVQMEMDNDDFATARIHLTASVHSIFTNNEQRDNHLRTSDFFSADKFPQMEFRSTRIEPAGDETYAVYGDLTLKGITHPVRLDVEYNRVAKDPWGLDRAGFAVTGKLRRSDWGINFNNVLETGGVALGEEVKLNSDIQLVKQAATVPA